VVLDVVHNDLTEMATHVLPVTGPLERSDVTVAAGRTAYSPAIVPPGAERRPPWWIYGHLAREFGLDVLGGLEPDACTDDLLLARLMGSSRGTLAELKESGPRGVASAPLWGWVHEKVLRDGRWRIAPALLVERLAELVAAPSSSGLVLVSGREVRNTNSVGYGQRNRPAEPPSLRIHPDDAEAAGVLDGQPVEVSSMHGALTATAHADPRLRVGVVSLSHGSLQSNVNAVGGCEVDPQTGQPVLTAIPVRIDPA
jgi:anaerobic selenocysteine-containing dehydrogenase